MFEFDPDKSTANKAKHGLDFDEAQALWADQTRREIPTRRGAPDEERWAIIGKIEDKIWTAVVTYRGGSVRLISVRRARENEEVLYGNDDRD